MDGSSPSRPLDHDVLPLDWGLGIACGLLVLASSALAIARAGVLEVSRTQPDRVAISVAPRTGSVGGPRAIRSAATEPASLPAELPPAPATRPAEPQTIPRSRTRVTTGTTPSGTAVPSEADAPRAGSGAPCTDGSCSGEGDGTREGPSGSGDGPPEAPLDDEAKAAIAAYRATLVRWLSSHYRVTKTGLDPDVLAARKVRAMVMVGDDLLLEGFEVEPSGYLEFDEAARKALQQLVGQPLPPPPPEYPGPIQRRIKVTFVCRPGACD